MRRSKGRAPGRKEPRARTLPDTRLSLSAAIDESLRLLGPRLQQAKVKRSDLGDLFHRIEIVSEKDVAAYQRVLRECGVEPPSFVMVGNSLRSDIAPVIEMGGWGVYMPYHSTWPLETDTQFATEVLTFLELPAGVHRFGASVNVARVDANDDDGYTLFAGQNPSDIFAPVMGSFLNLTGGFAENTQNNFFFNF